MSQALNTLIVGLGETGIAALRWCVRQGDLVRVTDTRHTLNYLTSLQAEFPLVDWCVGPDYFDAHGRWSSAVLDGVDRLILSPGLSPLQSPVKELLVQARDAHIQIMGEIDLFAQALVTLEQSQGYRPDVLAITGTNGKTTVTALTAFLIEGSDKTVAVAGNISPAALDALIQAIDQRTLPNVWVLELSSFQLETITHLHPKAAVVLNITQDHLDWHGDLDAYIRAKAKLLSLSDIAIVNRSDTAVLGMVKELSDLQVLSFGVDVPTQVADLGLDATQGLCWLVESVAADDLSSLAKKKIVSTARELGSSRRLMPVDALRIRGRHNALNAMAAMLLARCVGLPWTHLLSRIRDYRGEPHRVEFIRSIQGVSYIDDSKGTNIGATMAALEGLDEPIILIAGGVGKGQDFSILAPAIEAHAKGALLIGESAQMIADHLANTSIPYAFCDSLQAAVSQAHSMAVPGDVVLLSPACASFDMFKNYEHRAHVFIDAVHALASDVGEV